jgi:hypothetical protein
MPNQQGIQRGDQGAFGQKSGKSGPFPEKNIDIPPMDNPF